MKKKDFVSLTLVVVMIVFGNIAVFAQQRAQYVVANGVAVYVINNGWALNFENHSPGTLNVDIVIYWDGGGSEVRSFSIGDVESNKLVYLLFSGLFGSLDGSETVNLNRRATAISVPTAAQISEANRAREAANTTARSQPQPAPAQQPQAQQPAPGVPTNNVDYVLPYSSIRKLTDNDLRNLTKNDLRLARNEIYARYGRVFRDASLQRYFDSKSWYRNLPKLPLGVEPTLSQLERSNIELIQVYEAR